MSAREAVAETPAPSAETGGAAERRLESLDTPEARERSVRRFLDEQPDIRVRLRFCDATGAEHEIRSCPTPGGCFLFDSSPNWGLRAIGPCGKDDDVDQLATDYVAHCEGEVDAFCRQLRLSDLRRRSSPPEVSSQ